MQYNDKENNKTALFTQKKADGKLNMDPNAIIGKVNDRNAEILINVQEDFGYFDGLTYGRNSDIISIRWLEEGMEYMIYGNISVKQLSEFAKCVSNGEVVIPNTENTSEFNPKIPVIVDVEAEENEQKSVDAGHSPWKLDPVFSAQVFASLLISPDGIVGEYPIAYDDIEIMQNDGESAIAVIKGDNTKAERVYLKRLVRKDETGIWSVVGYDPVNP